MKNAEFGIEQKRVRDLARTDKRGAQGAGVPVAGRLGTAFSLRRGVTGESNCVLPCSLALLFFFLPQENIIAPEFRVYGVFQFHSDSDSTSQESI